MLNKVDQSGSDIEKYVVALDEVLLRKIKGMQILRGEMTTFYKNLKTEAHMANIYRQMQVESSRIEDDNNCDDMINDDEIQDDQRHM